jgi:hypothetical protein
LSVGWLSGHGLAVRWLDGRWLSMGWLSGRGDRGPVGHVDRGQLVSHLDDEGRGHGHRGHGQARPDNVADHGDYQSFPLISSNSPHQSS